MLNLFRQGASVGSGSRKAQLVDRIGGSTALPSTTTSPLRQRAVR
jgi:hypothetical protein